MTTERVTNTLAIPAPTAWPIVLAFGTTLLFAGLVTSAPVSVLGAMLMIAAAVGWFRDVLPHEAHEVVPVRPELPAPVTSRRKVAHFPIPGELPRAWLPLEVYPISAGIKGGLAGSVAMAVLAILYGLLSQRSIWYPINLLAAGFIAPLMWSGLLYSALGIINPVLNQRISWLWFVLSQVGFGIVAGIVVSRQERVRTWQRLPFAVRAGIEAPGMMHEHREDRGR